MSDEPRIHVYPADNGGCGNYRLRWPTTAARTAGVDVHDCHGQPLGQLTVTRNRDRIVTRITDPPDCDIIVLQRVTRADHVANTANGDTALETLVQTAWAKFVVEPEPAVP